MSVALNSRLGYYLTKHPSTRSANGSPGTPERPLSDLGLKGYTAYWVSTVLRVCRKLLADAPPSPLSAVDETKMKTPVKGEGRPKRERKSVSANGVVEDVNINDVGEPLFPCLVFVASADRAEVTKVLDPTHKGQYAISLTLEDLAKACHLRQDDTAFTLSELGFMKNRRDPVAFNNRRRRKRRGDEEEAGTGDADETAEESDSEHEEWKGVEIVISREMVEEMWIKWKVKEQGVLDESCVLL